MQCFTSHTQLSADELLIAEEFGYLVQRGMSAAKAQQWARVNVLQGVSNRPKCVIETISPFKDDTLTNMDINEHMGGFGFCSGDSNWTGD